MNIEGKQTADQEMTVSEYIDFLLQEIQDRNETQAVMVDHGAHRLDPNYRLDEGYINCLVRVVKDLSHITNKPLNDDFYPDLLGFIEENSE